MENVNFKWLVNDIYESIILKLFKKNGNQEEFLGTYEVFGVFDTIIGKLDIEFANIDDMTKLLTLGIVRFRNVDNFKDILDIPFRNVFKLYDNGNDILDNDGIQDSISVDELDSFCVIDDNIISDGYYVSAFLIGEVSDDLKKMMKIASNFGELGMQEKFDALTDVNMINYRRIKNDSVEN